MIPASPFRAMAIVAVFVFIFLLLFAGAACGTAPLHKPSGAAVSAAGSLTATCHGVDTSSGTLSVITGVGFALREVRFRVDPGCDITVRGAPGRLVDLRPGKVLYIRYRKAGDRDMAESIEALPPGEPGGAR